MRRFFDIRIDFYKFVPFGNIIEDVSQAIAIARRAHPEKGKIFLKIDAEFAPRSLEIKCGHHPSSPRDRHATHLHLHLRDISYLEPAPFAYLTVNDPAELFSSPYMTLSVSSCRDPRTAPIPRLDIYCPPCSLYIGLLN